MTKQLKIPIRISSNGYYLYRYRTVRESAHNTFTNCKQSVQTCSFKSVSHVHGRGTVHEEAWAMGRGGPWL